MKVVCKNNHKDAIDDEDDYELSIHKNIIEQYKGGGDHLILDKFYEVNGVDVSDFEAASECYYSIENESGQQFWYSSNRFKTVSEMREDKLNELGIDRDLILEITEFNYRNNIGFWGGYILIYLKDIFIENGDIQVIYLIGSDEIEHSTDMCWFVIKMDEYKIRLREKKLKKLGI